ncbi:MAG: HAD family hydrolase [Candidatus Paceibacterota bacterium]|jgi:HAD superfamily hydrolase (TIGR01549 family)
MKNIIFDWSGVVKDAVGAQLWKVNKIFEKYKIEQLSMEEFRKNFKQPYMDFYHTYLPNLGIEEQDEIYRELSFNRDCPDSGPFLGIVDLIKRLKEDGYYMAIVSSDFSETLLPEIKKYGLDNIFQDIITYVHNKEEGVYNLIKKRKLDKDNTYFIGDSNHEIEVSKATGIKSIAVTWGFATEEALKKENPDFIVHNIKELEDILLK